LQGSQMSSERETDEQAPDLRQLGRRWRRQADGLNFLGEIALDESATLSALRQLGALPVDYAGLPDYRFVLSVLAVNFAYHQQSDESFREPFLAAMGKDASTAYWDTELGPVIQRTIA